jgi:cobalt-zinc-cadmium resistance protein CzcA
VVIGGILSATLLTLLVLPALYRLAHRAERTLSQEEDDLPVPAPEAAG